MITHGKGSSKYLRLSLRYTQAARKVSPEGSPATAKCGVSKQNFYGTTKNKKANWTEKKTKIGCRYINKLLRVFNIKSCLVKSVAYKAFLNNVGWEAKLYIAVNNKKDFYSHSWVESTIETIGKPSSSMKIIRIVE